MWLWKLKIDFNIFMDFRLTMNLKIECVPPNLFFIQIDCYFIYTQMFKNINY